MERLIAPDCACLRLIGTLIRRSILRLIVRVIVRLMDFLIRSSLTNGSSAQPKQAHAPPRCARRG